MHLARLNFFFQRLTEKRLKYSFKKEIISNNRLNRHVFYLTILKHLYCALCENFMFHSNCIYPLWSKLSFKGNISQLNNFQTLDPPAT